MPYSLIARLHRVVGALALLSSLFASAGFAQDQPEKAQISDGYQTIEWIDLMPQEDLDALLNPPESLNDIADGSAEDRIGSQMQLAIEQASDSRYQQALVSTRIVSAFDGQAIRLPGFIVPLEFGDEQRVTKFFLVPYFGACIHMPPPPPNQIVYAEHDAGFPLQSVYEPFWLSGRLSTTMTENDVATAAYAIAVDRIEPYTEE